MIHSHGRPHSNPFFFHVFFKSIFCLENVTLGNLTHWVQQKCTISIKKESLSSEDDFVFLLLPSIKKKKIQVLSNSEHNCKEFHLLIREPQNCPDWLQIYFVCVSGPVWYALTLKAASYTGNCFNFTFNHQKCNKSPSSLNVCHSSFFFFYNSLCRPLPCSSAFWLM